MIPENTRTKIEEALTHQPFQCGKVLLYEIGKDDEPIPCDDESKALLATYREHVSNAIKTKSGAGWYGNAVGGAGGWYYAACSVGLALVITGKRFDPPKNGLRHPPPIDSYFLNTVLHCVAHILGVPMAGEPDLTAAQLTPAGVQVFSELQALQECEELWRKMYGNDEWLIVKNGTVIGHDKDRTKLETFIRENAIMPPVLYVSPKDKEIVVNINSCRIRQTEVSS